MTNALRLEALLVFVVGLLMGIVPVVAQSQNPAWTQDLEYELATYHECKVVEFLSMHEGSLGGRDLYTARIQCADKRMFDAYKLEPQEQFLITRCEQVIC